MAEGHFGTKAEAESHADMAVAIAQHDMFDLLWAFNENVVDPLLALNFGPQARGLVTVSANPLSEDKAVLARTIVQTVLTAPTNTELLLKVLNFDAMLEQQGLPVSGAGVGVGEGEDREGQAREGELQVGGGGEGGEGSEDAQVQELARGLMRKRELSRWRLGRGRGRTLVNTRDKAAVDLAGFNADEPRDERGRWMAGYGARVLRSEGEAKKGQEVLVVKVDGSGEDSDATRRQMLNDINHQTVKLIHKLGDRKVSPDDFNHQLDNLNAKRDLLRKPGDIGVKSDGELHAITEAGKAKLDAYDKEQQRQKVIAGMGVKDRLEELLGRLIKNGHFGSEMVDRIKELMEPKNLAMMAGMVAVGAGIEAIPVAGPTLANVLVYGLLGKQVVDIGPDVAGGINEALRARTDKDFDEAAGKLAHGLSEAALAAGMLIGGYAAGKVLKVGGKALKPVGDALAEKVGKLFEQAPQRPKPIKYQGSDMLPVGDEPGNNMAPEVETTSESPSDNPDPKIIDEIKALPDNTKLTPEQITELNKNINRVLVRSLEIKAVRGEN